MAAATDDAAAPPGAAQPPAAERCRAEPASITQRLFVEERLDSADEPRPRTVEKPVAKGNRSAVARL